MGPYANQQAGGRNRNATVQFSDQRGPSLLHPSHAIIAGNTSRPVDGTARRRISAARPCPRWAGAPPSEIDAAEPRRGQEDSRVLRRTAMPGPLAVAHVERAFPGGGPPTRGATVGTFGNNEAR